MSVPIGSLPTAIETLARGARGQSFEREVPQLDRAAPLKVRACRGTREGWSVEGFALGHALCRSYPSCVTSALTATPHSRGVLPETCRVRVRVRSNMRCRQNMGACAKFKGIPSRQFFAGVACTWLQADPVEPQFPYWYRRRYRAAFHDTAILNSARERHMPPTYPQQ